jgi:hypothetical protein
MCTTSINTGALICLPTCLSARCLLETEDDGCTADVRRTYDYMSYDAQRCSYEATTRIADFCRQNTKGRCSYECSGRELDPRSWFSTADVPLSAKLACPLSDSDVIETDVAGAPTRYQACDKYHPASHCYIPA